MPPVSNQVSNQSSPQVAKISSSPTSRTGEAGSALARFDSINVESDRITNSVNTLAEQIMQWTRTPEFAALHKRRLELAAGNAKMDWHS